MEKTKRNKLILIGVIVLALLIAGGAVLGFVMRDQKFKATTMRLLRRVNIVTLEDANGKEKPMTDNMKLQSGNALKTEADSMVSVGLDEYKVVTVEEKSRAEFYQTGKKLELNLTEGSLFIDVSQHLADDESFDVRTSTMTAGIRGTTIYVNQNPDGTWTMYLVSGALHVRGQHPKTLEEVETDIVGGQKVTAITFDDRTENTIILQVEEFSEETMPLTLIEELLANKDAMDRAAAESGFDPAKIAAMAGVEYESEPETEPQTEATETETTETETESSSEAEENNEPDPEGEGEEVGNEEPAAEDDDGDTGGGGEDVSDDGNTEDEGLTKEESEATIESEEGFNIEDYLDYIDEKGIWHLKDGTLFDPAFYKKMYGDVLEIDGFVSEEDMLKHYLEYGKKEKRFTTQESYDAFTEQYEAEKRAREEEERKAREEAEEQNRQEEEDVVEGSEESSEESPEESSEESTEEESVVEVREYSYILSYFVDRGEYSETLDLSDINSRNNIEGYGFELQTDDPMNNPDPTQEGRITRTTTTYSPSGTVEISYSPDVLTDSLSVTYIDNSHTHTDGTLTFNFNLAQVFESDTEGQLEDIEEGYTYRSATQNFEDMDYTANFYAELQIIPIE